MSILSLKVLFQDLWREGIASLFSGVSSAKFTRGFLETRKKYNRSSGNLTQRASKSVDRRILCSSGTYRATDFKAPKL